MTTMQILPWLSYSVPGVLNLASFSLETGTALWCFLLCVIVDPGRCGDLSLAWDGLAQSSELDTFAQLLDYEKRWHVYLQGA